VSRRISSSLQTVPSRYAVGSCARRSRDTSDGKCVEFASTLDLIQHITASYTSTSTQTTHHGLIQHITASYTSTSTQTTHHGLIQHMWNLQRFSVVSCWVLCKVWVYLLKGLWSKGYLNLEGAFPPKFSVFPSGKTIHRVRVCFESARMFLYHSVEWLHAMRCFLFVCLSDFLNDKVCERHFVTKPSEYRNGFGSTG